MSLADIQSMKALKILKDLSKDQVIGNLFNQSNILDGYQLNNGVLTQNATYFTSDYIPIEAGEQVLISHARNYAIYDSSHNFVAGENLNGHKTQAVVSAIETTSKYVRFSTLKTNLSNNIYIYKIPLQMRSRLRGKMIAVLGDSITGQGYWQPYLRRKLGVFINSYGVGGTRVTDNSTFNDTTAMCRDERINVMISFCDYCIFMGGTNDWGQNTPIGTITDTATNTFYGALKVVAQKLIARYPTSKIIFAAPPCCLKPGTSGWNDTTGEKNNLGFTIGDYGLAIKDVARLYGYTFVDLYANGWNKLNIANYVQAETNTYIHPDSSGGERMAIEFVKTLNNLADLT